MSSILLISSNPVHQRMAGPGIRYWEMAAHLAEKHDVTLLVPGETDLSSSKFQILRTTRKALKRCLGRADVVITQGYKFPLDPVFLSPKPLVVDLYDPLPIEILEHRRDASLPEAALSLAYCLARTQMLLYRGDFFICSHERQRDFWLGMLVSAGRVRPELYRKDPTLKSLIQLVPYGLPSEKPVHTRQVLKGVQKGIADADKVVLWGGGLWKWFDPCMVIKAIHEISRDRHDIKLVFMGAPQGPGEKESRPSPSVAQSTEEALRISKELGLYDKQVFFTPWIPYQERQNYLLEADMGISTHFESLESRFAFRTRILDYLWCELPVIATKGDFWSDFIEREGLGIVLDPKAFHQLKAAILEMADCPEKVRYYRDNLRRVAGNFSWPAVLQPLEAFCSNSRSDAGAFRFSFPEGRHTFNTSRKMARLIGFYLRTTSAIVRYNGYQRVLNVMKNV